MSTPHFDGETYDPDRDHMRLTSLLNAVLTIVSDGKWYTLFELAEATGAAEASISARLRDLRKPKFGGHTVERRYISHGLWEYRFIRAGSDAA